MKFETDFTKIKNNMFTTKKGEKFIYIQFIFSKLIEMWLLSQITKREEEEESERQGENER